jgi:uncharacterized protein YkwD
MRIIDWILSLFKPTPLPVPPTPPTPVPEPVPPPAPVPQPTPVPTTAEAFLAAHNTYRAARGKEPLTLHPLLIKAAEAHAEWMRQHGMRHTGFPGWLSDAGYAYSNCGENIGWNYHTPEAMTNGWMSDIGHRMNVLGDYSHAGFAVVNEYWCGIYASPRAAGAPAVAQSDSVPDELQLALSRYAEWQGEA